MKNLSYLLTITALTLSLAASAEEKQQKEGMMEMHKRHMKCMEQKGKMGCQEMMMKDCRMNKDMCRQMMEDMEKGKSMHMNKEKKRK